MLGGTDLKWNEERSKDEISPDGFAALVVLVCIPQDNAGNHHHDEGQATSHLSSREARGEADPADDSRRPDHHCAVQLDDDLGWRSVNIV